MKYLLLAIFMISFASAGIDGIIGLDLGSVPPTIQTGGNYSINVNNTIYHQGLTPKQVADLAPFNSTQFISNSNLNLNWLTSFGNTLWCALTGCTIDGVTIDDGNVGMNNGNITDADKITTNCITLEDGFEYCTLATTYYNSTSYINNTGRTAGLLSSTQHSDGNYDGITFNITEQVSAPALNIEFNFTDGMTDITQGIVRYYTSSLAGDVALIQLWDYEDSDWETYGEFGETLDFRTIEQSVFDASEHIQNGTVRMRLYKAGTGNNNNKYYIDWLAVAKGFGVPAGQEVDPLSYHTDENINATGYNVTADYYKQSQNNSYGSCSNGTDLFFGYTEGIC